MLDIGFTKLAVIGAAALIVIGPERLPTVARMAGRLLGRAQRYLHQIKAEVSREIELEELRKVQKEMKEAVNEVGQNISSGLQQAEQNIHAAWADPPGNTADSFPYTPTPEHVGLKAKAFRKKKLARTSAIPHWFKQNQGRKTRVISGAARVAKFRPAKAARPSSFY